MSLVGSLEDLGLGDILQIIHLSRKSGVLALRSEAGEGRILFRDGLIQAAYLKDGPTELRELLAVRGAIERPVLEAAWEDARARSMALAELLPQRGLLAADAIDGLRREHVECVVLGMFAWQSGEFSFEVREVEPCAGDELFTAAGLNPQFLALEGTRQLDELDRDGASPAAAADPVFDGEEITGEGAEDGDALVAEPAAPSGEAAGSAPGRPADSRPPPVVVVDNELPVLEWIKAALKPDHPRVHIFQHSDLGVQRVRQYLARGEIPVVLLAADAPPDPLSGARDAAELVKRLKGHAAHMPVLVLTAPDAEPPRGLARARAGARPDGFVGRPTPGELADRPDGAERARRALGLRNALARLRAGPEGERGREASPPSRDPLASLREVSARIRDPATRGAILSHVLAFAREHFARVALFMVREGRAVGIAQSGLDRAGGPSDAAFRQVEVPCEEPAWFRSVLVSRAPRCAAPSDAGDRRLAARLGQAVPERAYVAPIESAGDVVALLYADNLPGGAPLCDPGVLEVVLHEAGLALDRAMLERALAEAEG